MQSIWNEWRGYWNVVLNTAKARAWNSEPLHIEPPAEAERLRFIEQKIGKSFPQDFRETLLGFSRHVNFEWYNADEEKFKHIYGGVRTYRSGLWHLDEIIELDGERREYLKVYRDFYEKYQDSRDLVDIDFLDNFLPFIRVANGDLIGFLYQKDFSDNSVFYYIHDDRNNGGVRLADSFTSFITKWSRLGCLGPEIWLIQPWFYDFDKYEIKADGSEIDEWKAFLDLLG